MLNSVSVGGDALNHTFTYDKAHKKQFSKRLGPLKLEDIFFSNVCSAMRKEVLSKYPFAEDLIGSEDQQWAKEVILAGYSIAYQPKAIVQHSHNYNLLTVFRRFFESGAAFEQMKRRGDFSAKISEEGLKYLKMEIKYMIENKYTRKIPYTIVYTAMKFLGFEIGKRNYLFPIKLRKLMSVHPAFWES